MILELARLPLLKVATSFVVAYRAVVVNNDTPSTNQADEPSGLDTSSTGLMAILSPMLRNERMGMNPSFRKDMSYGEKKNETLHEHLLVWPANKYQK